MNNKVIKLLVSLKMASLQNHITAIVPFSSVNSTVLRLLYEEGFIQSFSVFKKKEKNFFFCVTLRYSFNKSLLSHIRIISKPSLPRYLSFNDICRISTKVFFGVMSTDDKLVTLDNCKKNCSGGQLIFICI